MKINPKKEYMTSTSTCRFTGNKPQKSPLEANEDRIGYPALNKMKTAFIGHRHIFDGNIREKLYIAVEQQIKNGCKYFTMGNNGKFDKEALSVCRQLREIYKDLKIEVVITSFAQLKPIVEHNEIFGDEIYRPYEDVETIMYDIEETYFKKKITESNRQMIDTCDTLICYVDENYKYRSGALTAYKYAKKKGLRIVNLFVLP